MDDLQIAAEEEKFQKWKAWMRDEIVKKMSNRFLVWAVRNSYGYIGDRYEVAERDMIFSELCDRLRAAGFIQSTDNLGKPMP